MSSFRKTYKPNPALRALYSQFFDRIHVDDTWIQEVRALSTKGTIVYVLPNRSLIDFLALDHLTKRHSLPQISFAQDLGLGVFNPMGKSWMNRLLPVSGARASENLRAAIHAGSSATLFLKRPANVIDVAAGASGGRALKEGDELMLTLIHLQRELETPILLVPQVFIWTNRPDSSETQPLDWFLGSREWPSSLRVAAQMISNFRHVSLRLGEPIHLKSYLDETPDLPDRVRIRRITDTLLKRLERERRSVTGPTEKPPDRVRQEILRSPKLASTINELGGERPGERKVLTQQALHLLRAMQATPETSTMKGFELALEYVFSRIYAGVEADQEGIKRLRQATKDGTLVLLPSHKSHVDYLVLSYIFRREQLQIPLIAAGDNLSFFPLGPLFRRGGAFFIRRRFKGDRLYTSVVNAYIRRLIRDGFPLEFFLEGGRSRTGKLLSPKLGLLKMVVDAANDTPERKVYFAPIHIGYERVVEASSYEHELTGGDKTKENAAGLLSTPEILKQRYGRVNLQVGPLLTLRQIRNELQLPEQGSLRPAQARAVVTRLGHRIMDEINLAAAVTPGALTALALLSDNRRGIPHEELVDRCGKLLQVLLSLGARATNATVTPSGRLRPKAIREAIQLCLDSQFIEAHLPTDTKPRKRRFPFRRARRAKVQAGPEVIYSVNDVKRLTLDISKNMILHFLVERALVATALLMPPGPPMEADLVEERVRQLSRLFKFEFRFHADRSFEDIFNETVATMIDAGEVQKSPEGSMHAGHGREGWTGQIWLQTYASLLKNFIEGYRVAARGLSVLVRGSATEKELQKKALTMGQRMYFAGEIERREAVSKPLIENAYQAFIDQGYLQRSDGKLELAQSFKSTSAVKAIEGRIASYLGIGASP